MLKSKEIKDLFAQFENAAAEKIAYHFPDVRKVIEVYKNAGESISYHFVDVNKMVEIGSGAEKEIDDIHLTCYACYLVAQNELIKLKYNKR